MEVRDKSGRELPTDDRAGRAAGAWTRSRPPPSFPVSPPSSSRAVVVLGDTLGCDFWSQSHAPMQYKLLAFPPTSPEYIVPLELDELVVTHGAFPATRAMSSTMRTMGSRNISASRVRRGELLRCHLCHPTFPDRHLPTSFRRSRHPGFSSSSSVPSSPSFPEFTRYARFLHRSWREFPMSATAVTSSHLPPLPPTCDLLVSPSLRALDLPTPLLLCTIRLIAALHLKCSSRSRLPASSPVCCSALIGALRL